MNFKFQLLYIAYYPVHFIRLLENSIADVKSLISAQISAGDAIMTRLWHCVKDDKGRIDEQIDKVLGFQLSAKSLTWSYANILHALHTRKRTIKFFEKKLS